MHAQCRWFASCHRHLVQTDFWASHLIDCNFPIVTVGATAQCLYFVNIQKNIAETFLLWPWVMHQFLETTHVV